MTDLYREPEPFGSYDREHASHPCLQELDVQCSGGPRVGCPVEPVAVAVHLQDMDVVGQPVEQRTSQPLGGEHAGPLVKRQVGGDDGRAGLVALAEHLEQQFGTGLRQWKEAAHPWRRRDASGRHCNR